MNSPDIDALFAEQKYLKFSLKKVHYKIKFCGLYFKPGGTNK